MFEQHNHEFNRRELVLKCCDSAISTLDIDRLDEEFGKLIKGKYVDISLGGLVSKDGRVYVISERGIIFVRQNIAKIQNACNQNKIPNEVISKQDDELKQALKNKIPKLIHVVIKCGTRNIGPILDLIKFCT